MGNEKPPISAIVPRAIKGGDFGVTQDWPFVKGSIFHHGKKRLNKWEFRPAQEKAPAVKNGKPAKWVIESQIVPE